MAKTLAELKADLAIATNPVVIKTLENEIQRRELQQQASSGDEVANALLLMQQVLDAQNKSVSTSGAGLSLSTADIEKIVEQTISTNKINIDQLDNKLKQYLVGSAKVQLELKMPTSATNAGGEIKQEEYERPLFQKLLCDLISMNNVYLFGGAGTGKTFIAEQIAEFMGYDFVLLSCNQFTSQLDILGGQTIEGYQLGKLEQAWGNLNEKGLPNGKNGTVLCLDELPKIDPNTAGILNEALAKVKNYRGGEPPKITNGRGQKIKKGNLFIIATGNTKLNETSTEYEANFKQDLSLQDRFVGATYEVMADYAYEFNEVMKGFAFLWLGLVKLREKIVEMKYTSFAFVSFRIMITLRDTYVTYRELTSKSVSTPSGASGAPILDAISKPKTLKQGLDSFLNLFKPEQIEILKDAMGYDNFIKTIEIKNTLPLDALDTPQEISEAESYIKRNQEELAKKIA